MSGSPKAGKNPNNVLSDNWGHVRWQKGDTFSRDIYSCPPKSYGDLAFVQHMVACLKPTGILGVVLPHGILFRGGAEAKIRQGLLKDDLIEAVIGLAPNLFYGTGIPACVLIINRCKQPDRRGKVLFINGAEAVVEGKNQNTLSEANVTRLATAFHAFQNEERFARVVEHAEIETNDWNLNLARYVETAEDEAVIDVAAEVKQLKQLLGQRDEAETKMLQFLSELGYNEEEA